LSTQNQINGIEIEGGWSGIGRNWFVSQPQQHGIWIDYSSAASQNGTPFTVEDVLIKNLLQGAAFAFSQARANGLFKTVKL